jgi:spermidine synthase
VISYEDGRTATISVVQYPDGVVSIATNGKSDAGIMVGHDNARTRDEVTMLLLGSLPLGYKPDARVVGNIGIGSGLTTHTLLADPDIEVVDTVEIEAKMAEAAELGFGRHVERTFNDPRSRIHIADAKTFFSLENRRYDVIVAEPSNPWVSGVASLFTTEFYGSVSNYLVEDGLFVQWLQLYEFNDALTMSVLKALSPHFSDFVIYNTNQQDIMVIAKRSGELGEPDFSRVLSGRMGEELRDINVITTDDLLLRRMAEKPVVEAMFDSFPVPPNSDYFPYLDLGAGKARYAKSASTLLREWVAAPLPVVELLHDETVRLDNVRLDGSSDRVTAIAVAEALFAELMPGAEPVPDEAGLRGEVMILTAHNLALLRARCTMGQDEAEFLLAWHKIARASLPFLTAERATKLAAYMAEPACWEGMSADARNWLDLTQSVAARDAGGMARYGRAVLQEDRLLLKNDRERLPDDELLESLKIREYVLTATMLGLVETRQPQQAYALWMEHGEQQFRNASPSKYAQLVREFARSESFTRPDAASVPALASPGF